MPKHKDKPLLNAKRNTHSTLTLIDVGFDLTSFRVTGDVKDASDMVQGVWSAKRSVKGDQAKELRLLLKCKTSPQTRGKFGDPPDGTVTVTVTDGTVTKPVTQPVDYANDDPPP